MTRTTESSHKRMTVLAGVVAFMFAALLTRLWFLQVLAGDEYAVRAEGNRVRLVSIQAPRGQILDRNGTPLVSNEDTVVITVDRTRLEDGEEGTVLARLSELLGEPEPQLRRRLNDPDFLPYQPVPVFYGAPERAVAYLVEHPDEFPGTDYRWVTVRSYEHEDLAAHLLGYLGEVGPEEIDDPSFSGVFPGQRIGRGGVEQRYEAQLHGRNGWLKLEVDAAGEVLRELSREPPRPGNDVVLALDFRVQRAAQEALADGLQAADEAFPDEGLDKAPAGAIVILEPNTGHVVAMASEPSFDPSLFLEPMPRGRYAALFDHPKANSPDFNRAISGLYPAASTFKPIVASAAINAGYATPNGSYNCPGEFVWEDQEFANWTPIDQGPISLTEALVQSCDTVFYNFGAQFYLDRQGRGELFQQQLRRWGFERLTGIDLPGEAFGRVPDEEWVHTMHDLDAEAFPYDQWFPGYDINLSIGQGDLLVTPLQLATAFSAIANGGTLYQPQVAIEIRSPSGDLVQEIEPRSYGRVPADRETLSFLRRALTGVTSAPSGTATAAFSGFPLDRYPVAAKTGTAQHSGSEVDHAWFAAMAPADDPEYVVVVLAEESGYGGAVAAPIARRVLEAAFDLPMSEFRLGEQAD